MSDKIDSLGVPQVNLYWKKSNADLQTAQITAGLLGKYIAEQNYGRIKLFKWVTGEGDFPDFDQIGGHHHMGGTRMAYSEEAGVVDRDCRLFSQKNLFLAGSSVFPSGGHANPTLTIVQLALRLSETLSKKV